MTAVDEARAPKPYITCMLSRGDFPEWPPCSCWPPERGETPGLAHRKTLALLTCSQVTGIEGAEPLHSLRPNSLIAQT